MFLQNIIDWFKKLFRVTPRTTDAQQSANATFAAKYQNITDINITAWVANKIANMVVSDSDITVVGKPVVDSAGRPVKDADGKTTTPANNADRAAFLGESLKTCTDRLKNIVQRALAVGGVVLKPYAYAGKLYTDILTQDRMINVEQTGDVMTATGFIAEVFVRDNRTYTRTEYHRLDNGTYTIEQKASIDDQGIPLSSVPEWAHMNPSVTIGNVDQMLFGFIRCPIDNRTQFSDVYGVPLTYGQEKLIAETVEMINQFYKEYILKKARLGGSSTLFRNKKTKNETSGADLDADPQMADLFVLFDGDGDNKKWFETYSPDIRAQAYIDGINYRLGLIEKNIGTNQGVLTDLETRDATATAIRRSTFDTWALVDDIRTNVSAGIQGLVYAFDIYANAANLAPRGQYDLDYSWDYSLLEDTTETFTQLAELESRGGVTLERLNMFVTGNDEEQAAEEVAKAKAAKPSTGYDIDSLLGGAAQGAAETGQIY